MRKNHKEKIKSHFGEEIISPIKIIRIKKHLGVQMHSHEFYELVIISHGTATHITEHEKYKVYAGDVFLINKGESHRYGDIFELSLINILYLPKQMQIPLLDIVDLPGYHAFFELEPLARKQKKIQKHLNLSVSQLEEAKQIVKKIENEINSDILGKNFLATAYFMQLKILIARAYSSEEKTANNLFITIAESLAYMKKNYCTPITLETLANRASMSKSSLNRRFIETTGLSPIRYLLNIRIHNAAEILKHTKKNVSEVAFATGFQDSNYFVRQFQKTMGITPGKYKKENSKK